MRIWHRRSLKADLNESFDMRRGHGIEEVEEDDEDYDDDEEAMHLRGRYFPNLLRSEDDEENERTRNRRSNKMVNNSWPPMTSNTFEQYEVEEESDEEDDEDFNNFQSHRQSRIIGWRIPNRQERTQSRSTSSPRRRRRSIATYEREDSEQNGFFTAFNLLMFVCLILLLIFLFYYVLPNYFSYGRLSPKQRYTNFRKDLSEYFSEEFDEGSNSKTFKILSYIAAKISERDELQLSCNDRRLSPLTLLIADSFSNDKANLLAGNFSEILQRHWPYRILKHHLNSNITRIQLDRGILSPVIDEKQSTTFALSLEGLEKLSDKAPLFLHSLADPESSPLLFTQHNVLIIGTLKLLENEETQFGNAQASCDERIEKALMHSWKSDALSEDQIHPIIARISAHSVCLD
uniref:Uncharacterized protein n=1 Tax=Meloidogyne incognita TaxID=6306 RepID=A0A914MJ66_MELIC